MAQAGRRLQQDHRGALFAEGVEFRLGLGDERAHLAILRECQLEQAAPEFVGRALGQRFGLGRDAGQAGFGPRPGAARRRQSLGDEEGADAVLHRHAPAHPRLPAGDGRPPLPHLGRRQDHRRQLAEPIELGEA